MVTREMVGLIVAALGLVLMLWGMRHHRLPECRGCGAPLADGYFACKTDGACFCRVCAKRLGLPAWYEAGKPDGTASNTDHG